MNLSALKGLVGAVAPTLGQAIGGPLGGTAMQAIASVMGCEPNERAVSKAVQSATPEQLAKLKKQEQDFEIRMKELDVDVYKLTNEDVQDARKSFAGDWTPRVFGLFSLCGFLGYIFLVTIQPPDANSDTIVSLVLGYLGGLVSGISSFYFGSSHKGD